jgi:outer membrane protein OmpA-like peptidoglycan-associated protein
LWLVALALAGTAWLGTSALAQDTSGQGQFTPDANGPIHLHMPTHLHMPARHAAPKRHKAAVTAAVSAAPPSTAEAAPIDFGSAAPSPAAAPPPPPPKKVAAPRQAPARAVASTPTRPASYAERRKAVREVLAGPASATSTSNSAADVSAPDAAIPFSFDSAAPPPPASKPAARPAPPKTKSSAVERHRPELASLGLAPKQPEAPAKPKGDPHAGMTRQGQVLFSGTDIDPQAGSGDDVKTIATALNSALDAGAARVELEAYGGPKGDKSSDARRLSLRRALAVRQLLIDNGVPAERIDVKAQGGTDDSGTPDRVDVFVKA